VTINPTADLASGSGYYVNMASGVIRDLAGNNFAGINGNSAWNFSTVAPAGIVRYGTDSSDRIVGTSSADLLSGVPISGSLMGRGTVDLLTGGLGNDLFILGDVRGRFYDDRLASSSGMSDYAVITDFQVSGDRIQLSSGNYFLSATALNGINGAGIYFDTDGNRSFGSRDELIGLLQGVSSSSISSQNFTWV
jgi:Ca2+-binding RTX toxin-like protein